MQLIDVFKLSLPFSIQRTMLIDCNYTDGRLMMKVLFGWLVGSSSSSACSCEQPNKLFLMKNPNCQISPFFLCCM
jgi:hypothetical protein